MNIKLPLGKVVVVLWLASLACTITSIGGAPINVTKTADTNDGECTSQDCSLREAVIEANERAGKNKIVVPAGIYLMTFTGDDSLGQLIISDDVIIEGAGSGSTIIDGNGQISSNGLFYISDASADISNLTIRNTDASGRQDGGAILTEGDVELLLKDTIFSGNSAVRGGALFIGVGANVRVEGSTFDNNNVQASGGAIFNEAILAVHKSQITANHASIGAGLYNSISAQVEIFDSNLQGNRAVGVGGAIVNGMGVVHITRSSLIGNWATDGGAAINDVNSFMQILSSTISANRATGRGAGLMNTGGQLIIKFSTIFNNFGDSGIYVTSGDTFIENTIVHSNEGAPDERNCTGEITSNGHNLMGDNTCGALAAGDMIVGFPALSSLSWDGNTSVHPLDVGSPAIDAAANLNCPDEDQQLNARPQDGDGGESICDIGAYEYSIEGLPLSLPSNTPSGSIQEGTQLPTLVQIQPEPTKVPPTDVPKPTKAPAADSGISGVVWLDADFQGDLDAGETRFSNVTVELRAGDCNAAVSQSVQTDTNGQYTFSGLQASTYCVRVDINSLPPGNWGASVPPLPPNQSPTLELTVGAGEMLGGVNFGFQNVIQ